VVYLSLPFDFPAEGDESPVQITRVTLLFLILAYMNNHLWFPVGTFDKLSDCKVPLFSGKGIAHRHPVGYILHEVGKWT